MPCAAEKEQALITMKSKHKHADKPMLSIMVCVEYTQDIQLQDCAVSPSFSLSEL